MKYRKLKLEAKFEDIGAAPLLIENGKTLNGKISKQTFVYLYVEF